MELGSFKTLKDVFSDVARKIAFALLLQTSRVDRGSQTRGGMNKKQKESTAKLLYKFVEITYTGVIIANLIPGKTFNRWSLLSGVLIGLIAYLIAIWLDKREDKHG